MTDASPSKITGTRCKATGPPISLGYHGGSSEPALFTSDGSELIFAARLNAGRFDPLEIVQAFNRLGVEYVVIEGYAGELHAAAVPPTRDIDFTPRVTQENLGRLSQALTDLGAQISRACPKAFPSVTGYYGGRHRLLRRR